MAEYPRRMSELKLASTFSIPLPAPSPIRAVFPGTFRLATCIVHPHLALDFFYHFYTRYIVHSHAREMFSVLLGRVGRT